jgi:mRNA-degrading endonuclease toxin of MazEF toxin-antitoxin module
MNRGEILLASVPYLSGTASKHRPVLVVQANALRSRVVHTIVAAISSNVSRAAHPEC